MNLSIQGRIRNTVLARLLVLPLLLAGCTRIGVRFLYRNAALPDRQIHRDLVYVEGSGDPKHRLDLFVPKGRDWPVLVFVHGGGWTDGDKGLRVGGVDVYGNIGRFYAARGIGVAVINYRLQPAVTWREQVRDVARAVAWVDSHIRSYGGDPGRLVLAGHSAGAHLSAYAALHPRALADAGVSSDAVRGVIAVSGAALDISDPGTYELGAKPAYYETRFREGDPTGGWKREASPVTFATAEAPPFLILFAEGESAALKRQSRLLDEALRRAGAQSRLVPVPGESHSRIVLTLSRADKDAAPAMTEFIHNVTGS